MQLQNTSAIVTGGSSGLGAATARALAQQGAFVVIADINVDAGNAVATEIGGQFVHCDVASEHDAVQAVNAARAHGPLRVLVNCAGIAPAARTLGKEGPHPLDLYERVIRVNLVGTFNMIRIAATEMAAAVLKEIDGWFETRMFRPLRESEDPGAAIAGTTLLFSRNDLSLPRIDWQVGPHITLFEACSAFTHVTAYRLAGPPRGPFHRRLRQYRYLHCRNFATVPAGQG